MILTVKSGAIAEFIDITSQIQDMIHTSGIKEGFCHLYVPHTTAGITINENADPGVKADILMVLNEIVPCKADYLHIEGNSPAHIKAAIVGVSEWIAVENSRLVLGTWQGIFFCEFDGPRTRKVYVRFLNEN